MGDDGRPHVSDDGAGPPVVFFHAFPLDATQWDGQVTRLRARYRCLRPDWFGCGGSPPPPEHLTLDRYAAAVLSVLDDRGIHKFAAVGLSMGGYVTFSLMRCASDRITALVLASTKAVADTDSARADRHRIAFNALEYGVGSIVDATIHRVLSPHAQGDPRMVETVRAAIGRCSPAGIAAAQRAMAARPDSTPILSKVDVPTLVIGGDHDEVTPPSDLDAIADGVSGSRRVRLEGAGHLANLEASERFTAATAAFLDEALVES